MDDKKSTRFSLDELARQLAESVPQNLKVLGQDLERNFKTLLQSGIERMDRYTVSRRLVRTNADGEREYLDDSAVAEARAKAAADVQDWCG